MAAPERGGPDGRANGRGQTHTAMQNTGELAVETATAGGGERQGRSGGERGGDERPKKMRRRKTPDSSNSKGNRESDEADGKRWRCEQERTTTHKADPVENTWRCRERAVLTQVPNTSLPNNEEADRAGIPGWMIGFGRD